MRPDRRASARWVRDACQAQDLAVSDLELDAPVQRVAKIVGAGSHKVLAEAAANRYQAAGSLGCLGLDPALDCDRSILRELVVVLLSSRVAGVTDDGETGFGSRDFARNQAQPHGVGAADLRIGQEIQRAGTEQEFDGKTVGRKTEGNDFRECFFSLVATPELAIG